MCSVLKVAMGRMRKCRFLRDLLRRLSDLKAAYLSKGRVLWTGGVLQEENLETAGFPLSH